MAQYWFQFRGIQIRNTRSRGTDTDYAAIQVRKNGSVVDSQSRGLGDLNNGFFPVNLLVGPVDVSSADKIDVSISVINAGNDPNAENHVNLLVNGIAAATAGVPGLGELTDGLATAWQIIDDVIGGEIFADCDGPVVAGRWTWTGDALRGVVTKDPGVRQISVECPGVDSPDGCGSNSNYRGDIMIGLNEEPAPATLPPAPPHPPPRPHPGQF